MTLQCSRRFDALQRLGDGVDHTTVLDGRRVLRVALIDPATADMHLARMLDALRETGRGILAGA